MDYLNVDTINARYHSENGILVCELKPDVILDLEMAKKLVQERKRLGGPSIFPYLLIIKDYLLLDKEALQYFTSEEGLSGVQACSLVVNSSYKRIITNLSTVFSKNRIPFKLFSRKSEAKLWLFKFVLENERKNNSNLLSS